MERFENKNHQLHKAGKTLAVILPKIGEFNNLMQQMIKFIFVELCKNLAND